MMRRPPRLLLLLLAVLAVALPAAGLGGCSTTAPDDLADSSVRDVDPTLFVDAAIVGEVTEEACVLSGGTETTCYRFSVNTDPVDHAAGPWCPATITDDASQGGIWPEGGQLYDVDGSFVENLDSFYNDPTWKMYDDDGNVRITETQEACAAAANPNVGAEYANYCVECQTSYIEPQATITYVIPKRPVVVSSGTGATSDPLGVAFNGISFAPAAPTDRILAAYTLAPVRRLWRPRQPQRRLPLPRGDRVQHRGGPGRRPRGHDRVRPGRLRLPRPAQRRRHGAGRTSTPTAATPTTCAATTTTWPAPGTNQFVGSFRGEYGCALEGDGAGLTCDATQTTARRAAARPPGVRTARRQRADGQRQADHTHAFPGPHDHH